MSRSYHITKKSAMARFASGDTEGAVEFSEKTDVKKTQKKYRKIYGTIHPSAKPEGLRNSVTVSAVKTTKKGLVQSYRGRQQGAELGASPKGDPATPSGSFEASEGPPSVS